METQNQKEECKRKNTKPRGKLNVLVVGNQEWIKAKKEFLSELKQEYKVQFLTTIDAASERLWHNSYDLLIIEHKFCKQYSIDLTQYSYARSKPSIILCQNKLVKIYYDLWKKFSGIARICATIKKLMFTFVQSDEMLIYNINKVASHHYYYQKQIENQMKARW